MNRQTGFSFTEITIIVVLFAILAVFAIPKLGSNDDATRRAAFWGAIGALGSAVSVAKAVNRTPTPSAAQVVSEYEGPAGFQAVAGGCPSTSNHHTISSSAGTEISLISNFGENMTYCVSLGYASGNLTKPADL